MPTTSRWLPAAYPGVAAYWLSPSLARLRERGAGFSVRMVTAERDADITLDEVDCAILFGRDDWAGCDSIMLMPECVVPIASPRRKAELLADGPLIHLDDPESRWFDWRDWRRQHAPRSRRMNRAITVTNHSLAIHQALQGEGIALGWLGVVADLIEGDALLARTDTEITSDRGYQLVARSGFFETEQGSVLRAVLAA